MKPFLGLLVIILLVCGCRNGNEKNREISGMNSQRSNIDLVYRLANLADSTRVINNPASKRFARGAMELAVKMKSPEALALANKALGMAYFDHQDDSAYQYLTKALLLAESAKFPGIRLKVMFNLARLNSRIYNYKQAMILMDSVIREATKQGDFIMLSNAYNSMGVIYADLHDSVNAGQSFVMAYNIADQHHLYSQMGSALTNRANFEPDPQRSIELYRQAIWFLKKTFHADNNEELASIMINIGIKHPDVDSSMYYLNSGLNIAGKGNFPELEVVAFNILAYKYLEKNDARSAENCLKEQMIPLVPFLKNSDLISMVYDTYADVLAFSGKYEEAFQNQKLALNTRIRSEKQQASSQVRLLAGILDLKNKETVISENSIALQNQELRIQQMRYWLVISILILVFSISSLIWFRNRSRMKIHQEKVSSAIRILEFEEREKNKLAREIHDTVGHMVQGIIAGINALQPVDSDQNTTIKEQMAELGEMIRRISHRMNAVMIEKFRMEELVTGLCEDYRLLTGMNLDYRVPRFVKDLSYPIKMHLSRIIQELLTNAQKYAPKARISLTLAIAEGKLLLFYKDDGPGFEKEKIENRSMGLINIGERIKLMDGTLRYQSAPGKGTSCEITIPLH